MDLDSSTCCKLRSVTFANPNFKEYRRILEALCPLENPRILSGNGYIIMYGKLIERSDRVYGLRSNYIYCSVCDSLVFISKTPCLETCYRDNYLKRCINGDIISNEHARRKEILQSIDERESTIWLFFPSTSHSEKDKLASISYDYDARSVSYEAYLSAKATVTKNTMPSAPDLNPFRVSPARQEMIPPTSYQSSNWPRGVTHRSDTGKLFISSLYVNQPKGTVLRLEGGTEITVV
ncbi:hypothetical protein GLOIN_2v1502715 [Rhizophagus clarus]|uniref:Uncharacterized protein n=1 Tax=Rhizophagus clarus TaxID=94130 RepID=A0A8H3M1Y9_9GLOM|nr:hypothetical protein GLOIN_2v1502715 [Rhizophagus clarus]